MDQQPVKNSVVIMPGAGERDPNAMLEAAKGADLNSVVILGWGPGEEGQRLYLTSSCEKLREIQWLLANGTDEIWSMIRDAGSS